MSSTRIFWFSGLLLTGLLASLLAFFGPVRISITLARDEQAAVAAPVSDLPTVTPPLPTATTIPASPIPATVTPLPPATATSEPASPAPAPPEQDKPRRREPTPSPTVATPEATPVNPTQIPGYPNITIKKTSDVHEGFPGDRLTFTLTAHNTGQQRAADVVVTDRIPELLEVIDLRSSKGDIIVDDQVVSAYPRTLEPGEHAVYTIVTRIRHDAPAGEYSNLALITTSTEHDDPGDNTSTTTFIIKQPNLSKQSLTQAPSKLPRTNDPDTPTNILSIYWPLLMMALLMLAGGVAMRMRAFDLRSIRVFSGAIAQSRPSATPAQPTQSACIDLLLDPDALYQQWQQGTTVTALTRQVANANPHADRLTIAVSIQRLLSEFVEKQ